MEQAVQPLKKDLFCRIPADILLDSIQRFYTKKVLASELKLFTLAYTLHIEEHVSIPALRIG